MIHETLFYLWNNPLHVIEKSEFLFELQEFLHPGEQKLLERIVDVAIDYHKIVAFTEKVLYQVNEKSNLENTQGRENPDSSNINQQMSHGLYTKAFCSGVDEVLKDYTQEIIRLEELFLQNPQLSLTYILSSVEKYWTLFQVLKSMIQVIQENEIHGCLLMGRLHKYMSCGINQISSAADEIIKSINRIFYCHLSNWIIYGDLVDINNEFFICDGKGPDENFLYPEQLTEEVSASSANMQRDLIKKSKIRKPPIVRNFYINWNMVPMFLNEDTAECILFMGRIVWIVRNDPKKSRDIWEGKDMEYYKKIQELENETFNTVKFQETIETCRLKLTKYLWSIMLDEGNLIEHLHLIRDYYALGRGELFQQFITVAETQIKDTESELVMHNLNYIFLETARKIYGENDKTYLRFELTTSKSDISLNPWSRLEVNFEINWPLHIVFYPKVMELYNKLFCYLLHLRKTQIDLNKLWHDHISSKQKIDRRVWTLRQNLMFLVNNLQYYLQVDVIEAQFSVLLKAVQNANEFEDIIKVHHEFISNLLAKTFVLTPDEAHKYKNKHCLYQQPAVKENSPSRIYNVINRLLQLCDEFCLVASTWSPVLTEPEVEELDKFKKRSDVVIESLLFVLYSLHEKASGQHLLQLLSQLDFNRFFSKNKPDYNLSVT